jgi:hypothetical protein
VTLKLSATAVTVTAPRAIQGKEQDMKFLAVYRPGTPEEDRAPSQEEMESMGKLIGEMAAAGVLLATEGCKSSRHGARLAIDDGRFTVTDGPFPETKELIQGLCLMQTKTKAEAIEWTKRFLALVKVGSCEIRQLNEP